MTEPITVRVPWTPDPVLSPNARCHWTTRSRAAKAAKDAAFYMCVGLPRPNTNRLTLSYVVAWEKSLKGDWRKEMDQDNLIAALKAFQDGVALALLMDDKHFTVGTVEQIRDPEGQGWTEITISPTSEEVAA